MKKDYLLEVKNLKTYFYTENGVVPALDGVSFKLSPGKVIGLVGESGCGKSVASLSILRLIQSPPGKIEGGNILFNGSDLLSINERQMKKIRGNDIAMIFQEPMTSLNPVFTVGDQIGEAIQLHQRMNKKMAQRKTVEMLKLVGISRAEEVVKEYPNSLSGGMRQRVMIAMALSCQPQLLIADEPTTALDVTIQAQSLELMQDLRKKINMSIIFISHDLGVIAEMAEQVVVMYAGKVVEDASIDQLLYNPLHPYTQGLLKSKPKIEEEKEMLDFIPGVVPNLFNKLTGCYFQPRCVKSMEICKAQEPGINEVYPDHFVKCWLYVDSKRRKQ